MGKAGGLHPISAACMGFHLWRLTGLGHQGDQMETAVLAAMRHLDGIEAWNVRAETMMMSLSGKTPPILCAVLTEWPLLSSPMAEALNGVSRASVQRNFTWMEDQRLIRELTAQGQFRMWRALN